MSGETFSEADEPVFDSVDAVVAEFNSRNGEIISPDSMSRLVARIQETSLDVRDRVGAVSDVLLGWSPDEVRGYSREVDAGEPAYA